MARLAISKILICEVSPSHETLRKAESSFRARATPVGDRARLRPMRPAYWFARKRPSKASLFDHLVGAGEQTVRHVEAEGLCGLEVDHQLVLGRCLHRQVGGLLAFENAVDVAGRASVLIEIIRSVREQAAALHVVARRVDQRQSVPSRQRNDQITITRRLWARRHNQTAIRGTCKGGNVALDLVDVALYRDRFEPERRCRRLDGAK